MPLLITSLVTLVDISSVILHFIYTSFSGVKKDAQKTLALKAAEDADGSAAHTSNQDSIQPTNDAANTSSPSHKQNSKRPHQYDMKQPLSTTKPGQVAGAAKTNIPALELFNAALENLEKVAVVNQGVHGAESKTFTYAQLLYDVVDLRKKLGVV